MKANKLLLMTILTGGLLLTPCGGGESSGAGDASKKSGAGQQSASAQDSSDPAPSSSKNENPNVVTKAKWNELVNKLEFVDIEGNFSYKYWWDDDQPDVIHHLWIDNGAMKYDGHGNELIHRIKQDDGSYIVHRYNYSSEEDIWEGEIVTDQEIIERYTNLHDKNMYYAFGMYIYDLEFDNFTYDAATKSYKAASGTYNYRDEDYTITNIEIKFEDDKLIGFSFVDDYAPFHAEFYDYVTTHIEIPNVDYNGSGVAGNK